MRAITPELTLISEFIQLGAGATILETRELDFNLARLTAVVINEIFGEIHITMQSATGQGTAMQEIDRDPDNTDLWHSAFIYDDYELDTSRLFRQGCGGKVDVTATSAFAYVTGAQMKSRSFRELPLAQRPVSLTNLRHHCENTCATRTDGVDARIMIYYQIVELSESEVGFLYASRR